MKRIISFSLFASLALFAVAAEDALKVDTLLKSADKYDGKAVFVTGKVSDFQQKTSRKGNKYFVFKMKLDDNVLNVYGQGEQQPVLETGNKVEIRGIFRKTKVVGDFTVKNEVDVTAVKEKPYGVKKID